MPLILSIVWGEWVGLRIFDRGRSPHPLLLHTPEKRDADRSAESAKAEAIAAQQKADAGGDRQRHPGHAGKGKDLMQRAGGGQQLLREFPLLHQRQCVLQSRFQSLVLDQIELVVGAEGIVPQIGDRVQPTLFGMGDRGSDLLLGGVGTQRLEDGFAIDARFPHFQDLLAQFQRTQATGRLNYHGTGGAVR